MIDLEIAVALLLLADEQAIGLIGELYKADESLKELSAKECYEKRQGML